MMLLLLLFIPLGSIALDPTSNNALYQCGVRRRIGVQLIERGWVAELGQWPWHAALFHVASNGSSSYACGGTLLDQRHVLTAAHCVTTKKRKNFVPIDPRKVMIHLGQYDLLEITGVQQRKVSEVRVHEEYSTNRNDIAVLVLSSDVEYSDFVIPICLDRSVDADLGKLEGQRGSVAGWGLTENHTVSQLLRTAQMPVVSHVECVQADPTLFGRYLDRGMFCAGERNGTSVCNGDSGGGFYVSEGDRWVLKGVVSFSGVDETRQCDTAQYAGFANVQNYLGWIRNATGSEGISSDRLDVPRRKSEIECDKYKEFASKRGNGICLNSRQPHSVALIYKDSGVCSGALISNKFVLTACSCMKWRKPISARIGQFQNIKIAKTFCHPQNEGFVNDLALLELESEVEFAASVIPACLANNWTENLYDTLLLTGFKEDYRVFEEIPGFTGKRPQITEFVESVDNLIITKEECRNRTSAMGGIERITDSQLCVYSPGREIVHAYASNGLAGGALQTYNSRTCLYSILGVCADSYTGASVTIYSRVARFLDWVEPIVWGDNVPSEPEYEDVTPPEYEVGNELSLGSSTEYTCTYKVDHNRLTPVGPVRKNTVVIDISKFMNNPNSDVRKLFEDLRLDLSTVKSVQPHTLRNVVLIEMATAEQAEQLARTHNLKHSVTVNGETFKIPVYVDGKMVTTVKLINLSPQMSNDCIVEFLGNFGEFLEIKNDVGGGLLAGIPNGKRIVQMKLFYHIPQWVLVNGEVGSVSYEGQLPYLLFQ